MGTERRSKAFSEPSGAVAPTSFPGKEHLMTMISRRCGLAIAAAGVMALAGTVSSSAAPVMSSTTGVKAAVSDNIVDVRWRRGWGWGGVGAGLAAGALLGAGIAAATAPRYYYGPGYDYYPAYGGAYAYEAPVVYGGPVYAPAYGYGYYGSGYQSCAVDAGYGRIDYSQC
jgi:hypothetical protein